ncbi:GH39 family glycosyl hydrolase [Aquisalinus flavus]|nr:hypothetical protein [Aquisalinus flavus]
MRPFFFPGLSILTAFWFLCAPAMAQEIRPTIGVDLEAIGQVRALAANEIESSSWSIGGETLDRDYAVFANYADHLGPLGAKGIRLQGGWAKTETSQGVYEWQWLDDIVDGASALGVKPWIQLSYGNPAYPGGGDYGLGGGLPTSPDALAAWDRWVEAIVDRYGDRVDQWEVWNEPDLNHTDTAGAADYAALFIRTARIVRRVQPDAGVYALALADDVDYARAFFDEVAAREQLHLIDAVTFHSYPDNPDSTEIVDQLRRHIAEVGGDFDVRQGETGATSGYQDYFALQGRHMTETIQAKWNLRRMLAHHAKSVPFNLFTMADLHYQWQKVEMNYKGLLATNADKSIAYRKPAYRAAQSVFSVFDDRLKPVALPSYKSTSLRSLNVDAYGQDGKASVIAYWFFDAPPDDTTGVTYADLRLEGVAFDTPVLVDLRTGIVYGVPEQSWRREDAAVVFHLPMYDSPMLLAERDAIPVLE